MGADHTHRVCTYQEAEEAIRGHEKIYVNDCFCRAPAKAGERPWGYCGHTIETCMGFREPKPEGEQYGYREISQEEALGLFENWKSQGNLFRFVEDGDWLCFCCSCGCEWFRDKEGNRVHDTCEKSPYTESTNADSCTVCGECVDACAYNARSIKDEEMIVDASMCYGCSACEHVCPENAIQMVPR